jgi:hypothetical protein
MMSETVLQPILITGLLRRSMSSLLGLPAWARLGVFMAIVFLRHPLGSLHADFWGEDGSFWYTDAYVLGWRSALVPHTGGHRYGVSMLFRSRSPSPVSYSATSRFDAAPGCCGKVYCMAH